MVKDDRVVCPCCKRKTDQIILPDSEAKNWELWCRRCKTSFTVTIERGVRNYSLRAQR